MSILGTIHDLVAGWHAKMHAVSDKSKRADDYACEATGVSNRYAGMMSDPWRDARAAYMDAMDIKQQQHADYMVMKAREERTTEWAEQVVIRPERPR